MTQSFGHIPDKPKKKYPNKKKYYVKKEKADIEGFIKSKGEVTAIDIARQFLVSEQTGLVALRKLLRQGVIEKLECGVHDKQVWKLLKQAL